MIFFSNAGVMDRLEFGILPAMVDVLRKADTHKLLA